MFEHVDWSKRGAYMERKHGVTVGMATEAIGDPSRVVIEPDYNSRSGESVRIGRLLGFGRRDSFGDRSGAQRRCLRGEWMALEHERSPDLRRGLISREGAVMNKVNDTVDGAVDELLAAEAEAVERAEAEADQSAPLPANASVTRGHPRSRNLQVRFREDEFEELTAYAEARGLPVSTVVRGLVLEAIAPVDDLKAALDKLETDFVAVKRQVLGVAAAREQHSG